MNDGNDMRRDSTPDEDEREAGRLLRLASDPALPEGATARLMARIAQERQVSNAVALPPRRNALRYAAALPLAASLALGVYLGAQGTLDFMLPGAITGGVAQYDDVPDDLGGVGEADAFAEESFS